MSGKRSGYGLMKAVEASIEIVKATSENDIFEILRSPPHMRLWPTGLRDNLGWVYTGHHFQDELLFKGKEWSF